MRLTRAPGGDAGAPASFLVVLRYRTNSSVRTSGSRPSDRCAAGSRPAHSLDGRSSSAPRRIAPPGRPDARASPP